MLARAFVLFFALGLFACAHSTEPASTPGAAPASSAEAPKVGVVEGSIMLKECPAKLDAKKAEKTMNALVGGDCTSVPGGKARFLATLKPGGGIEISAPDGSNEGTIPICVLKGQLKHKLFLTKPCTLEVQIEERKVSASK